jgi:2-polyprenyl-3-methyl-5-hydroxy-6-metoxy-1,4-benzoquinol methylase
MRSPSLTGSPKISAVDPSDPTDIVRRGYDAVSHLYRRDADNPVEYRPWLAALQRHIPVGASVLDLGCGCGIPAAATLADGGHHVTGVDLSEVQITRARRLVPHATFVQADANLVFFPNRAFDAVVCLYALIHMPLDEQPGLLSRIAGWLRPGGLLLVTTGAQAWTGTEEHWLGGPTPMWWSHADTDTYRRWIAQAGLLVESEEFVPENDSGHQLFWARSPR